MIDRHYRLRINSLGSIVSVSAGFPVSDAISTPQFEAKVTELVQATRGLPVPHLLQLRRLTLADPEALRWASERQLIAVFHLILSQAIEAIPFEELDAASLRQFDPLLPPGADESRDKDRWLLFELARKRLLQPSTPEVQSTEPDEIAPPLPDDVPVVAADFATLFDETLCHYTSRALMVVATPAERPYTPKPFYLHPGFAVSYAEVLRRFLLPDVRATKRIKTLAESRKWDKDGYGRLVALVQSADDSNPVLEIWDSRWKASHSQGVGGRRNHAELWDAFRAAADAGGWHAPPEDDIPLLRTVLRWEAELINEGWREMAQVYQQEFAPKSKHDQARPGAFRDCVIKWVRALPAHAGDALAIKAFTILPKCDRMFLRSLIQSLGSSQTARRRAAPLLISYFESLPP